MAMAEKIRAFFKTFLLFELLQGLAVTGRYMFARKITVQYPEEHTPQSHRFRGLHALRRYPNGEERCIACKLCEAVCPVDSIVETRILEYHGEKRSDLHYTKEMLLAVGDRYEAEIAKDRASDAAFR
jgi:NADH-quinone oxidoreductase subunit I